MTRLRHLTSRLGWLFVLAIILNGCGGGTSPSDAPTDQALIDSGGAPDPVDLPTQPASPSAPIAQDLTFSTRDRTARFLTQSTFGPTPTQIDSLVGKSASSWFLDERAKPASYIMPEFARLLGLQNDPEEITEVSVETATIAFWTHAIAGSDQLRQRIAFALSEIFVVSNAGGEVLTDIPHAVSWYQDILRRQAFGNYRDLLEEITYAPAMGHYLTYAGSKKADPLTGRMPDENYAREILQLFSIGLVELNPDGTPKLNTNGQPIETYTNADITGLAKVFTGLNLDFVEDPAFPDRLFPEWQRPMSIEEIDHSTSEKTFLNTTIPPFTPARESIRLALDAIFAHPNVGPFIGRQLIQRLTVSSPSPDYIARVSAAFDRGRFVLPDGRAVGAEKRGDLGATVAAVLFDPEVRSASSLVTPTLGKVREPILRFTAWARAFNVGTVTPELVLSLWDTSDSNAFAQHPYRATSVFNFFRPGYMAPGTQTASAGLTAPELQIVNASSTPGYANFMAAVIRGGIAEDDVDELVEIFQNNGINLDASLAPQSFNPDYTEELVLVSNLTMLVDHLATKLTYGSMRTEQRVHVVSALTTLRDEAGLESEELVWHAVLLVMLSPDFLVQR
ncbi:MAG: DUF1800 family protein [Pseudomonadota bacterium]